MANLPKVSFNHLALDQTEEVIERLPWIENLEYPDSEDTLSSQTPSDISYSTPSDLSSHHDEVSEGLAWLAKLGHPNSQDALSLQSSSDTSYPRPPDLRRPSNYGKVAQPATTAASVRQASSTAPTWKRREVYMADAGLVDPQAPKRVCKPQAQKPPDSKPPAGTFAFYEDMTTRPGEHHNISDAVKLKPEGRPDRKTKWQGGKVIAASFIIRVWIV